jgi:hypothetical protein
LKIRTPFFANATKPGGFSEAKDNVVTIQEHSAHSVWRFLKYCYTGDYPEVSNELALGEGVFVLMFKIPNWYVSDSPKIEDDPEYLRHPRVHALADMLDVPGLKTVTADKMQTRFSTNWVTAEFPKIVSEVYSTTNSQDKTARDVLTKAARNHFMELSSDDDFKALLRELGEFSGGLVMDLLSRNCGTHGCGCAVKMSQLVCNTCRHYHCK